MNELVPDYHPFDSLCNWDEFVASQRAEQKPTSSATSPPHRGNRYEPSDSVRELYRLNHTYQTYDFVRGKEDNRLSSPRRQLSLWEAFSLLDQLTDAADPEVASQQQHLFQTAEAIRADGHPDWLVLTGLIHDLGKLLCLFGEPQWAVVGNTFPVGCRFADEVVYPEFFRFNPDYQNTTYQTPLGIYRAGQGLRHVHLSWGHGEYLYRVVEDYLPDPALYIIRYHSFFAAHRDGAYGYLLDDYDREMFQWIRLFHPYDDGAKDIVPVDIESVRPYYERLVARYLPEKLAF